MGRFFFKFEGLCFLDRVKGLLDGYNFQGCLSFVFANNFKALKEDLQVWNKQVFGDVGLPKKKKNRRWLMLCS